MRHAAVYAIVAVLLAAALVWSESRHIDAPVSPEPILNLIADTQRELTRLPVAFAPLPDSEEIAVGKDLEASYVRAWPNDSDHASSRVIEDYIQTVGARDAAFAHRKLPYRFHYLSDSTLVNAFALPGGPVFIGAGLLSLMDTEDELAATLGHEIEHIDHYHCAERVQVEAALRHVPLPELAGIPVQVFVAGYSKAQELEADREGARLAVAAGYSPLGAIRLFEAFERLYPTTATRPANPSEEVSAIAWKTLEGYFRSHPSNPQRIRQIQDLIARDRLPASRPMTPLKIDRTSHATAAK
jgi:beta-barrel assembly-enhancing protease